MSEQQEPKYIRITIKYGIGYGSHETEMEVRADATDDDIDQEVFEMVSERLDISWRKEET